MRRWTAVGALVGWRFRRRRRYWQLFLIFEETAAENHCAIKHKAKTDVTHASVSAAELL